MQSDSIVVSLVTVAPILVLVAAGNIIGPLILVIERCVHGKKFKTWSPRNIRWTRIKNTDYVNMIISV